MIRHRFVPIRHNGKPHGLTHILHHLPQPSCQSRSSLVHLLLGPVQWSHPRETFHCPTCDPYRLLLTGRWRPVLRPGVLQAPLPGPHTGPQPLHLQPRVLEPPHRHPPLAPCPRRLVHQFLGPVQRSHPHQAFCITL